MHSASGSVQSAAISAAVLLPADSVRKLEKDAPEIKVALSEPLEYEAFAQGLRNTKMFISPLGCVSSAAASILL